MRTLLVVAALLLAAPSLAQQKGGGCADGLCAMPKESAAKEETIEDVEADIKRQQQGATKGQSMAMMMCPCCRQMMRGMGGMPMPETAPKP